MRLRRSILLAVLLVAVGTAQTLNIVATPTSARPGAAVAVKLAYQDAPAAPATAFQWSLGMAGSGQLTGPSVGTAGAAAGKDDLRCASATLPSGGPNPLFPRCYLMTSNPANVGNVIPTGEVAVYSLQIPATTPPGTLTLSLSNLLAASPSGSGVPVAAGPPVQVTVLPDPYDVTGDGAVNSADLQAVWNQSLGAAACVKADLNGDAKCDILDLVLMQTRLQTGGTP